MIIDPKNPKHIIADEGYEFKRKASGESCGTEMYLGLTYYIGGVLQDPPHEDTIEDFEERLIPAPPSPELIAAREKKIAALMGYDSSEAVNTFFIYGHTMWIDPLTRANYLATIQGAQRLGKETIEFDGHQLPIDTAVNMIDQVNLYAMQCVGVTAHHKHNIENLSTVEEIEAYDFTVGYPEKIHF